MSATGPADTAAQRPTALSVLVAAAMLTGMGAGVPAQAGEADAPNLWDSVLQKLEIKAKPSSPAPDFVERTRPDATALGYIQPSVPHKVSPLAVKTPAEIQAAKDALDAAKTRQLDPVQNPPVNLAKGKKAATTKTGPAAD